VPLVEAGDDDRRAAQDALFAADPQALERAGPALDRARDRYREAAGVGARAARALDLVEQVEAELPYFGEWKARDLGRAGDGPGKDVLDLLGATAALARLVQSEPLDPPPGSDALPAHRGR